MLEPTLQNYLSEKLGTSSNKRELFKSLAEFIMEGTANKEAYALTMAVAKYTDSAKEHTEDFEIILPENYPIHKITKHVMDFYESIGFNYDKDFEELKSKGCLIFQNSIGLVRVILTDGRDFNINKMSVTVDIKDRIPGQRILN